MSEKKGALVDVSVLLIFFTRSEQFAQVFEQVRKARPARLFLYQDGPRVDHPEDKENIQKCREIAENIDWDCEVHRLYQEKNVGVDPSGYLADTWAFSLTDKCIVLEDDVVPSLSFFSFCKKMLDQYENDERVMLISGFNVEEVTEDAPGDYFFSSTTFTWGWASWGRVVRNWDPTYAFLGDTNKKERVQQYIDEKKLVKNMIHVFEEHLASGKEHFETILISHQYLNRGLTIVPKCNMINNIGVGPGATHYDESLDLLPKGYRRIFMMQRYELDMDCLTGPKGVQDYIPYKERSYRIYGWRHPLVKVYRLLETVCYKVLAGKGKDAVREVNKKWNKWRNKTSS